MEGWKSAAQILVSSTTSVAERVRVESTLLRSSVALACIAGFLSLVLMPIVVEPMSADGAVADVALSIWVAVPAGLIIRTALPFPKPEESLAVRTKTAAPRMAASR